MTDPHRAPGPAPERGTRVRSGNAMGRTRVAVLDGALRCVERYGVRKTTMSDVASVGGVAKGTLYNHFRTKDDVLTALLDSEVARLVSVAREAAPDGSGVEGLSAALVAVVAALRGSAAVARLAADEPALAAGLARPSDAPAWSAVRLATADLLRALGLPASVVAVDTMLRWVVSHVLWPDADSGAAAPLVAAAVATAPDAPVPEVAPAAGLSPGPAAGLGWPG